jgi:hypothetical protein
MIKLAQDIFNDKIAIVFLGGTSLSKYIKELQFINKDKVKLFIEAKALTNLLLEYKIYPDYIFCPFSEKLKDNYFQNFIVKSFFINNCNIKNFLKKKYYPEVDFLIENFNKYYEIWKPEKGIHKKYKIRKGKYLNNSPYNMINFFPKSEIFLDLNNYFDNFDKISFKNKIINLNFIKNENFNVENYYNLEFTNNTFNIVESNFINTSAICYFPILKFLGFKKIFLLGMDMDFLGSYAYPFKDIFKTIFHYYYYLFLIRKTLNGNFKINFPIYYRPRSEFNDLSSIMINNRNIYRVIIKQENKRKINNIKDIDFRDFLCKIAE